MASVYFVQDCGSHVQVLSEKQAPPPPPPPLLPRNQRWNREKGQNTPFSFLEFGKGVIILRLACPRPMWVLLHVLSQTAVNSIYLHRSGRSLNSLPYIRAAEWPFSVVAEFVGFTVMLSCFTLVNVWKWVNGIEIFSLSSTLSLGRQS